MSLASVYTPAEWDEIVRDSPLASIDGNQAYTLHRYWIWVDYQRDLMDWLIVNHPPPTDSDFIASKRGCAMYLWYSLLHELIEALTLRRVIFKGAIKEDLRYVRGRLDKCRDAVFHVPSDGQWDDRLFDIMFDTSAKRSGVMKPDEESVIRIRRITAGLGKMFVDELKRRGLTEIDEPK